MICVNARFLTRSITGAQRYAVEIARRWRRLDRQIRFLAPRDVRHSDLAQELGVEVVGRRTGVPWEQFDLPRALRRLGKPTLVGLSFTAPLRWQPSVITVHDVCFTYRQWVSRGFYWYYNWIVPRLCRRASRVVTVSEFSRREIAAKIGIPRQKIAVVPNAVSPEFVRLGAAAGDNPFGTYVLGVATLQRRKNFAALVRAFRRVGDPNVKLVIAGEVDRRVYGNDAGLGDLRGDARVLMLGYVADAELARLYRHARAFCYPSLYEGFGIPPLEAMALGCAVITSNTSSLPEVCGDAAHYVDPQDEAQIAAAIQKVLGEDDYRRELVARGRERAKAFDWDVSAERFLGLVQESAAAE